MLKSAQASPLPRYAAVPTRVAAVLPQLPPRALDLLRLCDGVRDLATLRGESPLPVSETTRLLRHLEACGLIEECTATAAAPARALSSKLSSWMESYTPPAVPAVAALAPVARVAPAPVASAAGAPVAVAATAPMARPAPAAAARAPAPAVAPTRASPVAFTHDEEAFFARPVEGADALALDLFDDR